MSVPDGAVVFVKDWKGQIGIVFAKAETVRQTGAPPTGKPLTSAPKKLRTKTEEQTRSLSLGQTASEKKTISRDTGSVSVSVSGETSTSKSEDKDTRTVSSSKTVTPENIPAIAKGYEDIYKLFLGGRLIYTNPNNASDQIIMPISELSNPLNGTFNLSRCGDTWKYLQIATGYRTEYNPENANKCEIWITPWFQIAENINTTATQFQPIMSGWNQTLASIGVFWNHGGDNNLGWYDFLINKEINDIESKNLNENLVRSSGVGGGYGGGRGVGGNLLCPQYDSNFVVSDSSFKLDLK